MAYSPTFPVLQGLSEIQAKLSYLQIILRSLINRNDSITHRSPSKCVRRAETHGLWLLPLPLGTQPSHLQPSNQAMTFPHFSGKALRWGEGHRRKNSILRCAPAPDTPPPSRGPEFAHLSSPAEARSQGELWILELGVGHLHALRTGSPSHTGMVGSLAGHLPKGLHH